MLEPQPQASSVKSDPVLEKPTHQSVHELNYFVDQKLEQLKKILESVAPELLEKVKKDNPSATSAELSSAIIKSVREDLTSENGRYRSFAIALAGKNPEINQFKSETGDDITPAAMKVLQLLSNSQTDHADTRGVEAVKKLTDTMTEERSYKGDLALRKSLELLFPKAAESTATLSTSEANAVLLTELRHNAHVISNNVTGPQSVPSFRDSTSSEMTPEALRAIRLLVMHSSTPGNPIDEKKNEILNLVTQASDSRGWKLNESSGLYADVINSARNEQNYYTDRQGAALVKVISQFSQKTIDAVEAMQLSGAAKIDALAIEFRKELNNPDGPWNTFISQVKKTEPQVAAYLQQSGGGLTPEFLATLNRLAQYQSVSADNNTTAVKGMAVLNQEIKSAALYDADVNVKKVLEAMFPAATSNAQGLGSYEEIGSLLGTLKSQSGIVASRPGVAEAFKRFSTSKSLELNADSLSVMRTYMETLAADPKLSVQTNLADFRKYIDAAAAQRGLKFDVRTSTYKS